MDHLQPARRTEPGQHAVGDGAGNRGDAPHHHEAADHAAGDAGEYAGQQRVLEEGESGQGFEEVHAHSEWSCRTMRTSPL